MCAVYCIIPCVWCFFLTNCMIIVTLDANIYYDLAYLLLLKCTHVPFLFVWIKFEWWVYLFIRKLCIYNLTLHKILIVIIQLKFCRLFVSSCWTIAIMKVNCYTTICWNYVLYLLIFWNSHKDIKMCRDWDMIIWMLVLYTRI